jgi:hypothetical protein
MMLGWLGWTIVYAVVIWGIDSAYGLLELWLRDGNRRAQEVVAGLRFVIPLGLAFLISLRLPFLVRAPDQRT